MRLRFSQHLARVADCFISWLYGILSHGPLDGLRPLDLERDVRKVIGVLLLSWLLWRPRAAMNFDSGAFVSFSRRLNRYGRRVLQIILEHLAIMLGYLDRLGCRSWLFLKLSWLKDACGSLIIIVINALSAQMSNAFRNQVNIEVILSNFTQFFLHLFSLYSRILLVVLALFKRFEVALPRFSFLISLWIRRPSGLLEHLWNIVHCILICRWPKLDIDLRIIFRQLLQWVSSKNWSIQSILVRKRALLNRASFVLNCFSFLQFDEVVDVYFLTWVQASRFTVFECLRFVVDGDWAIVLAWGISWAISVDVMKVLLMHFDFKSPHAWCCLQ